VALICGSLPRAGCGKRMTPAASSSRLRFHLLLREHLVDHVARDDGVGAVRGRVHERHARPQAHGLPFTRYSLDTAAKETAADPHLAVFAVELVVLVVQVRKTSAMPRGCVGESR